MVVLSDCPTIRRTPYHRVMDVGFPLRWMVLPVNASNGVTLCKNTRWVGAKYVTRSTGKFTLYRSPALDLEAAPSAGPWANGILKDALKKTRPPGRISLPQKPTSEVNNRLRFRPAPPKTNTLSPGRILRCSIPFALPCPPCCWLNLQYAASPSHALPDVLLLRPQDIDGLRRAHTPLRLPPLRCHQLPGRGTFSGHPLLAPSD